MVGEYFGSMAVEGCSWREAQFFFLFVLLLWSEVNTVFESTRDDERDGRMSMFRSLFGFVGFVAFQRMAAMLLYRFGSFLDRVKRVCPKEKKRRRGKEKNKQTTTTDDDSCEVKCYSLVLLVLLFHYFFLLVIFPSFCFIIIIIIIIIIILFIISPLIRGIVVSVLPRFRLSFCFLFSFLARSFLSTNKRGNDIRKCWEITQQDMA
eukprot:gene8809-6195_t